MARMALKNLNTEEMTGLSGSWVDPGPTRALLEKHPRTAGNVADLAAAHEGLVKSQSKARQVDQKLAAILASEKVTDGVYDRKARGVNMLLAALAELADDEAQARSFSGAQSLLHPDGLAFINLNFAAEAGVAALTRHRLKEAPEVQALLASISLPFAGKTLSDEVAAWLGAGDTLSKLETERLTLVDASEDAPEQPSDRKAQSLARNRWIRVVRAIVDQITLDASPDPDLRRLVLRPLSEAESRADARAGRASSPSAPTEPEDPTPVG